MKRSPLVRIQLLLVVVFVGLLIWRSQWGSGPVDADLALTELETGALIHAAFVVDSEASVAIDAAGSLDAPHSSVLAAYPWIVRRDDRTVVWRFTADADESERTLRTRADTIALAPATYDVWFTSYGPSKASREDASFLGLKPHWTNDAKAWKMALTALPGAAMGSLDASAADAGLGADALWTTGPVSRRSGAQWLFSAESPTRIRVRAMGSIGSGSNDAAWIEDAYSGRRVWDFSTTDTENAGGADVNRLFDGTLPIESGVYRARFESNGDQAWDHWQANPPLDPAGWGLSIMSGERVQAYDPWQTGALVSISSVRSGEQHQATISLEKPTRVVIVSTGEIGSGGTVYDYAWLERGEKREIVWTMTAEKSESAGGDRSNQQETVFLELPADEYTLHYQTDDSHAFGDWRRRKPDYPERWGVSVFLAPSETDRTDITVNLGGIAPPAAPEGLPAGAEPPAPDDVLFSALRLGNDVVETFNFNLDEDTDVRIEAMGELSQSGRYDYGWIERDGSVVWEMTMRNTQSAGGDERNRQFDGVVRLEPGAYQLHFETDFSHAFGDFGDGSPRQPAAWGIRLSRR